MPFLLLLKPFPPVPVPVPVPLRKERVSKRAYESLQCGTSTLSKCSTSCPSSTLLPSMTPLTAARGDSNEISSIGNNRGSAVVYPAYILAAVGRKVTRSSRPATQAAYSWYLSTSGGQKMSIGVVSEAAAAVVVIVVAQLCCGPLEDAAEV